MSPHDTWYDWFGINTHLFLTINGFHSPALDAFMLAATTTSHPSFYPFYIAIAILFSQVRPASLPLRNVAVFSLSYIITSALIVPMLKSGFDFPRPAQVLGETVVKLVGSPDPNHSFPSGHAAFAVMTAASLCPCIPRAAQFSLIAFAILACVSRVWVGAHYPADVLAGALIAILTVLIVRFTITKCAKT